MAKKSNSKLMGILGNALTMVFAVLALALMALPMMQSTTRTIGDISQTSSLGSVFENLGQIGEAEGLGLGALVMFLLVAIFASLLIVSSIVGLVGAIIGNKKLNMTLVNKILALVLVAVALVGLILTIVYGAENSLDYGDLGSIKIIAQAGAVLPLVFGLFATGCAFLTPSKKKA